MSTKSDTVSLVAAVAQLHEGGSMPGRWTLLCDACKGAASHSNEKLGLAVVLRLKYSFKLAFTKNIPII